MRTLLVLTVATLGACTDVAPTASGPPMPSARRSAREGYDPGAVPPSGSFAVSDTVNVYGVDGLLQEMIVKDGAEVDSRAVVTSRDASGEPLTISIDRRPWQIDGKTEDHIGDVSLRAALAVRGNLLVGTRW